MTGNDGVFWFLLGFLVVLGRWYLDRLRLEFLRQDDPDIRYPPDNQLKYLRELNGFTYGEAARFLGVWHCTYYLAERGIRWRADAAWYDKLRERAISSGRQSS
jgi:hypothetical protein